MGTGDLPGFGRLFARAAAQAVRMKVRGMGTTLPETEARVGLTVDPRGHADFVHLLGGSVGDCLHPGYVHAVGFPLVMKLLSAPDFPLPLLGMVHITNRYRQERGLEVGEELTLAASVGNARPHYAGTLLDAVVRISASGEDVAVDTSGYLVRGSDLGGPRPARPEREEFVEPPVASVWHLGADAGRKYARVSGDSNPIHLSRATAKAFGFDRAIVHGMYSASRAYTETGVGNDGPRTWSVEFGAPIKLPGTVDFVSRVVPRGTEYIGWRPARGDRPAGPHFWGSIQSE